VWELLTAKAHSEPDRKYAPLRILIIRESRSCHLNVVAGNGSSGGVEWVEVVEGTSAEVGQYQTSDWDLIVTHVADDREDERDSAESAGPVGKLRKLFQRQKLSDYDREERHATNLFLAEIQRDMGVALSAIETGDFDTLGEIAARLKHVGAIYRFEKISGLGAALLDTVPARDTKTARNIAQKLMGHLGKAIGDFAD
jgi:hypothetical protein